MILWLQSVEHASSCTPWRRGGEEGGRKGEGGRRGGRSKGQEEGGRGEKDRRRGGKRRWREDG